MLLARTADYTDRDFDSVRARAIALVQSAFPEWTDFDVPQFGTVLLELLAFVSDALSVYQDNQAREGRVSTATLRRSIIALARMFGYTLPGAAAATADIRLTLAAPPLAPVTIPAGTELRTPEVVDPVRFQLLANVVIGAGANPPQAMGVAQHSKTHTQIFTATGLADFEAVLDRTPYLDDTAVVTAGNGAYTQVDSFLDSTATDRHYQVLVDAADRATLRFGNGRIGAIPSGNVTVAYKVGGGIRGNVEASTLVVAEGVFLDAQGRGVRLSVTNPERASGGDERQSVAAARLAIPESIRAGNRTVSREDFEINARAVPGVARALMTTSNEDGAVDENAGNLYVIPAGGGLPSTGLKSAVLNEVTVVKPCTLTFEVSVLDPIYLTVNVWVRVFFAAGQTPSVVAARIRTALQDYFQISNDDGTPNELVNFGLLLTDQEIAWSDVLNVVRDTSGVRKIDPGDLRMNDISDDLVLTVRQFPVLGTITVVNATTQEIVA